MFQKLLAGITAAALCCTMPGLYWAASAEEQKPTVKTIQLDKSDRLSGTGGTKPIPESQITGRISISVQDNPVHLKVTKYSSVPDYLARQCRRAARHRRLRHR